MAIRRRGDGLQIDVQVTVDGQTVRHREKCIAEMPQARAREAAIRAALLAGEDPGTPGGRSTGPSLTLKDALELTWEKYWAHAAIARTVRSNMKTALEFFGDDMPVAQIDTQDADRYVAHLTKAGLSPSTIRSKCACMTKMFSYLHRRGTVNRKPYFEMPKPNDNTRDRVFSFEEEAELLRLFAEAYDEALPRRSDGHTGQDWADLVAFLMDTGCRPSEARRLSSRCMRGTLVDFKITKTNKPRTIPLTDRAAEALARQIERHGEEPFAWATTGAFRHAWDWARGSMSKSDDAGFIPYALRHTCATRLYDRTRDLLIVQRWLGHTDIKMTLRYAKLQPDDLERARDLLQGGTTARLRVVT